MHGTRWPASNPKLLQVEFSTSEEMEKCLSSLPPPPPSDNIRRTIDSDKVAMAWLTEQNFKDERTRVGFLLFFNFLCTNDIPIDC